MDVECDDELDIPQRGSGARASKNVQGASQEITKTVRKGKKAPEPPIKAQEKGKGKAKAKAKKDEIPVQEGGRGKTGHSRVTRSSQKKKVIS